VLAGPLAVELVDCSALLRRSDASPERLSLDSRANGKWEGLTILAFDFAREIGVIESLTLICCVFRTACRMCKTRCRDYALRKREEISTCPQRQSISAKIPEHR
jgi:hypothetical protein